MHWLDTAALSPDGKTVTATRHISATHPFVENNHFLPSALIELLAQSAAAFSGLTAAQSASKKIPTGVLAAINDFQLLAPIPVPATITLTTTREKSFGPLASFHLQAHLGPTPIAQARMTFHIF